MRALRIFGLLFFLITTGGKAIAISNQETDSFTSFIEEKLSVQDIEAKISPDNNEELSNRTISVYVHAPAIKISISESFDFYFSSLHKTHLSRQYINSSKYIRPGLDITDIIFPFHTFS